ncbi:3-keto-5-aminohexanoate cleavage protein [Haloarcula nitratireducens]|uniref:3-keto-5-aminohexanoate cleavage protein n=1 Tax=Haloarcula nitratireducens TaxID=2487749 RepID=A0AAW4PCU9_9EURY|nr:3-keto-5-aminohexanoate cleavage protein [Halomicroarcula nitratireducens]MBX0295710.1 3-keto-5-aminohexanoate cleavage protein [Halomicroarcula nitratireducens]
MSYDDYHRRKKVILTVATTGAVHGKNVNPNLPEQPEEIARQVAACEELGASIAHVHGRNERGENDASRLQEVNDAIRDRCEDIIIQNTTGGQSPYEQRVAGIRTDPPPEMASLDMGPFKRDKHIITNHTRNNIERLAVEMRAKGIKPEMEVFNSGQLAEVKRLIDEGLVEEPPYVNLIFGGSFTPARPRNLINMVDNLPENAEWNVLAVGPHQLPLTTMAVLLGGHVRVGMEDNLYYRRGEKAASNQQLVARTVEILDRLDREIATPEEAREMLGMPKKQVEQPADGD